MSMVKDPQATLDFAWDWTAWLSAGETISSATITTRSGLTKRDPATINAGKVTVWLSGGTNGQDYTVTCHIVTSQGREDDRSIVITVANR